MAAVLTMRIIGYTSYRHKVASSPSSLYNLQNTPDLPSCTVFLDKTVLTAVRCVHCSSKRLYKEDYTKLGLKENATADQIKSAYFKRAKELHPDSRTDGKNTEAEFIEMTEAYKRLTYESKFASPDFDTMDPRNDPRQREYWDLRRRKRSPEEKKAAEEQEAMKVAREKNLIRKIGIMLLLGIFFGTIFPALFISEGEMTETCGCDECLLKKIKSNPSTRSLLQPSKRPVSPPPQTIA